MKLRYLLLFLFIFCNPFILFSQEEVSKDTVQEKKIIAINELSVESERVNQRIRGMKELLAPNTSIQEIDSVLALLKQEILAEKDTLYTDVSSLDKRNLRNIEVEWLTYYNNLKGYQEKVNGRIEQLTDVNKDLLAEIKTWKDTKQELLKNNSSAEIASNIDAIVSLLNEVLKEATERIELIYGAEKRLTELILITNEVKDQLENISLELSKDYFVFDRQPLWKKPTDSILQLRANENNISISERFSENKKTVAEFFTDNAKAAIMQATFLAVILILLMVAKKKWSIKLKELTNPVEIQAKIVLKNPLAATVVVALLVSVIFYDAVIPNVAELFVFLVLLGTIKLLPRLTSTKFYLFLVCLLAVYLIHIFDSYLNPYTFGIRILWTLESGILMFALIYARRLMKENPEDYIRIHKIYLIVAPFYILLLFAAIVCNVIGMVGMSRFLLTAVLTSTILMMVLYLSVKIITSLVVLVFKLRRKNYDIGLQTVSTIVHATEQRFQPILFWAGMLIWLLFTIEGFEVLDIINQRIDDILLITLTVGESSISVGGVLSFTSIFVITLLLSKLASSIFQDEWMINSLPRGIAPAISLLMRIILICIGFYIALSSAGIDFEKIGFVLGALGVGIGFGLQNVVLNFVAGLILAFERPINLGDAIQIDNEFGVITRIGVRSSNIKSYSGYEAIIPNGDLISKKVVNWTLSNRDRRSNILLKTASNADPEEMIKLFIEIAVNHPQTFNEPEPTVFFKGYEPDGNLLFQLWYWSTFSETLRIDHDIALEIHSKLQELGLQAPAPVRRIVSED
ncbi:hypothetical protein KH5_17660 [Urechidicola sp. KH5]